MSTIPLRVMIVEDSPDDMTLLVRILRKSGFELSFERVETEDSMRSALLEKPWDIILSDYRMPTFDGLRALAVLKETGLDIPLIIVSGTIGEEIAVGAMKAGACDYVMKDNLPRLIPAIQRELKEAASREEKKKGERELRQSEDRYRMLADSMEDVIWQITPEMVFTYVSPSIKKQRGYDPSEILGRPIWEFITPDSIEPIKARVAERFKLLLSDRGSFVTEPYVTEQIRKDGATVWTETITTPVFNDEGQLIAFQGVTRDITDRKLTEEALRLSEEKYRIVVEKAHEGILIAQEGILSFVNPGALQIVGYDPEEVVSKPFTEFIHPNDRDMVLQRHLRRIKGEELPSRYSFRIVRKDGQIRWVEIDSGLVSWEGRPAALFFMTDITERKRMEDELRQSEEWYRSLVEDSFDGIFVQKGPKIIFANSRLYEMLGYSEGELEGMDHWLVYHPDYQEITCDRATARMRGEQVTPQYEVLLQKKDGSSLFGEISARPVKVRGESGIQVWIRDISGRKRSEEVQKRLATAIEQSIESVMITDRDGIIQYTNPAFEHISGYQKEEVIGRSTRFLKSDRHDSSYYKDQLASIRSGKPWKGRLVSQRKDGQLFYEDVAISPVRDSSGQIVNFVDVGHDVTEQVELQKQLLQSQKMEAVGTLAGGIAHDFNNLLQVVLGYSDFLLSQKQTTDPEYDELRKIYQAGKRGADLVQNLMMFSRKVEPNLRPVNLNDEVVQVQKLLSRTISKTIKINLHLGGDLEFVEADISQVGQILMNLGVNARDAMPDGGTLTIETMNIELYEDYCSTHLEVKPGRYALLTVSDSGHGMDKETLSHIFEPFFSTKEAGKGTGLGLATVFGIVKQHKGHVTCYSEPGHGTTFKIYFPAVQKGKDSETPTIERPIRGGTETILLVDDEDVLRDLGISILTRFGYEVITAGNGKEALDIYQREGQRISLVILDLIMPEMDGRQCLVEILRVNPNIKVLIASGHSENGATYSHRESGARGFVEKPYNQKILLELVREILDAD